MRAIKPSAFFAITILFSVPSVLAKEDDVSASRDNLYSAALFASIAEMDKSWGHIDDSNGGEMLRTDYHYMTVERNPDITNGLPSRLGDYRVSYLDSDEQVARYKKVRKSFSILRIHPIQNDGPRLQVQVSVYYVSYHRGRLGLALSDWSKVEFRYDCQAQKYVVSTVRLGGI